MNKPRNHHSKFAVGKNGEVRSGCSRARQRRIRQRVLSVDQCTRSNVTATYRAYKRGALFANPSFTQIHPTCIPVSGDYQSKLTLMSESLRNDGRVWVPKRKEDRFKPPSEIPEGNAIIISSEISQLRQPCAARHFIARREGGL